MSDIECSHEHTHTHTCKLAESRATWKSAGSTRAHTRVRRPWLTQEGPESTTARRPAVVLAALSSSSHFHGGREVNAGRPHRLAAPESCLEQQEGS